MTYTVVWSKSALAELAELWNSASDRKDVSDASNQIDLLLRSNPYGQSESREQDLRILLEPPLAILFEISEADRMVTVCAVWRSTR
jgi:hypothetical protein